MYPVRTIHSIRRGTPRPVWSLYGARMLTGQRAVCLPGGTGVAINLRSPESPLAPGRASRSSPALRWAPSGLPSARPGPRTATL